MASINYNDTVDGRVEACIATENTAVLAGAPLQVCAQDATRKLLVVATFPGAAARASLTPTPAAGNGIALDGIGGLLIITEREWGSLCHRPWYVFGPVGATITVITESHSG